MPDPLLSAKDHVRRHFPELAGAEPKSSQSAPGVTVFTFRKPFTTADGASLPLVVRVTVADDGRVLKAVSSR